MAEENDDDSFGDFAFASASASASASTITPAIKSGEILITDDDEWGDFTFIQQPTPENVKSPEPQLVKIRGALPLSIFGEESADEEEEEEEEEGVNTDRKAAADVKDSSSGINDLPANVNGGNGGLGSSFDFVNPNLSSSAGNGIKNEIQYSFSKLDTDLKLVSGVDKVPAGDQESDDDDEGWEFRGANTNTEVVGSGNDKEFSHENNFVLGSSEAFEVPIDMFAFSNGVQAGPHERNNGFDFNASTMVGNGLTSNTYFQTEGKTSKFSLDSQLLGEHADTNETFGVLTAFQEGGSKQASKASPKSESAVTFSNFGIEEPQDDNSLNLQQKLDLESSTHGKDTLINGSESAVNDLFSDWYSQVQPSSSFDHEYNPDGKENKLYSAYKEDSLVMHDDDNLDDGSWDFQDAFSQQNVENEDFSFKKKLNSWMSFYSNLKDELYIIARSLLHSLKEAHSSATLAGDEMKAAVLDEQIKDAFEELQQDKTIFGESQLDHYPQSLAKYFETLHQSDFQVLESEYHISRRLSSAESDLRAAIELIKHSTAMLKILSVVPPLKLADYVSTWFKIISVCAQELKHGVWLLKQSIEMNVQNEMLSEPRGKQFVIALGEIYRVVVIFGASAKLYRPWMLLSSADLAGFNALLEECYTLWSTLALDTTTPDMKSILESIKHVQDLDALALANEVFQTEPLCQLSLLSPRVMPEMRLIQWDGHSYFLTLANLWANLISPDPPKLSSVHVG